jgi:hypothetical protein
MSMKNWMGVMGGSRRQIHQKLDQCLVDLTMKIKPALTVLDAVRILTANGPQGGSLTDVKKPDTVIVGVSPDKAAAQTRFKDKFDLPFTLLADVDHKVAEAYGAWVEKSMYGRKYMGIERSTFLIGKDGKLKKIFRKVKPDGHAVQVYEALQSA